MATKYPENPIFGATVTASQNLRKSFKPFKDLAQKASKNVSIPGVGPSNMGPSKKSVDLSKYGNVSNFVKKLGPETTPYGGSTKFEKFHPGIDIANKIGTNIPSFTGGTVRDVVTGKKQGDKGYGNYVIIEDAQGGRQRYSHLNQAFVKVGQQLDPGFILGTMGNTGSTYSTSGGTGSHLDYRIRDAYNKYINPYEYLSNYQG